MTHVYLLASQHHATGALMSLQAQSYNADHGQLHSRGLSMLPVSVHDMPCFYVGTHMAWAAPEAVLRRSQ